MPQSASLSIHVRADARPFLLFAEVFKRALKVSQRPLDLRHLGFELIRAESDHGAAGARELTLTLYPSDALLRFVAAALVRDLDLDSVKVKHDELLKKAVGKRLRRRPLQRKSKP